MSRTTKSFQATQESEALATALHRVLEVSHRQAKGLIDASCVKVNGEIALTHGLRLKAGDTVDVSYDAAVAYKELPRPKKGHQGAFDVLWEDKHLLFVNKPAGLLTVPAEKGGEANLADAIVDSFRRRGFKRFQLYIVHRLDRFTSGVLVFAKTPEALHGLKKYFEAHDLQRIYKAVLVGELTENSGTLTDKLIEHNKSLRMSVDRSRDKKGAKQAITHYRVLERLPGHTVVEVKLETGRRNQIRVQFADKGYPLLGDQVYGEESELIDRQALHAELLGFKHPVTGDQVTVSAALPPDLEAALKTLRTRARVHRAEEGKKGEEGIFKPKITLERKLDRVHRAKRFAGEIIEKTGAERSQQPRRPKPAGEETGRRPFGGRPGREEDRPARPAGRAPARPDRDGAREGRGPREGSRGEGRPRSRAEDAPEGRRPSGGRPRTEGGSKRAEGRPERGPGRGPSTGPRGGRPTGDRKPGTGARKPGSAPRKTLKRGGK